MLKGNPKEPSRTGAQRDMCMMWVAVGAERFLRTFSTGTTECTGEDSVSRIACGQQKLQCRHT